MAQGLLNTLTGSYDLETGMISGMNLHPLALPMYENCFFIELGFGQNANLQSAKANQDFVLLTRDNYKDVATTVSFALKQIVPNV